MDLRTASFDDWLAFYFDRPVDEKPNGTMPAWAKAYEHRPWDSKEVIATDPRVTLAHMVQLCETPAVLLERYTKEQAARGIDALRSLGCGMRVDDPRLPLDEATRLIRALHPLYDRLLARHREFDPEEVWGLLAPGSGWDPWNDPLAAAARQRQDELRPVFLATLSRMLTADRDVQRCAVWILSCGVGGGVLDEWLETRPDLDPELEQAASLAQRGIALWPPLAYGGPLPDPHPSYLRRPDGTW